MGLGGEKERGVAVVMTIIVAWKGTDKNSALLMNVEEADASRLSLAWRPPFCEEGLDRGSCVLLDLGGDTPLDAWRRRR